MAPHSPQSPASDMFWRRLDEQINLKHPLVRLAGLMDWEEIHRSFAGHFSSGRGRPALSPRLIAGLLYLQHAFDASGEAVVGTWVERKLPRQVDNSELETSWLNTLGRNSAGGMLPRESCGRYSL